MRKKYIYVIATAFLIIVSIAIYQMNKPIKIALLADFFQDSRGFVTSSSIGAKIAEEDINKNNGINGKKVKVVLKNTDFSNPKALCEELVKNNIEAVVTTANSENLYNLKPYLDEYNILCISSSSTATSLSNIDDNIYRLSPDDTKEVSTLLNHIEKLGLEKKFVLISGKSNEEFKNSVKNEIIKYGGSIMLDESWDENVTTYKLSDIQVMNNADAIIILAQSKDCGLLVQNLKNNGVESLMTAFSWSADFNLINYGGKQIEDFIVLSPVDFTSNQKEYIEFDEKLKYYNKKDGLLSNGVYKAFIIFKQVYEKKYKDHITIKEAFNNCEEFDVLGDKIELDEYGDYTGMDYILVVKHGEFTKLEDK